MKIFIMTTIMVTMIIDNGDNDGTEDDCDGAW